MWPNEYVYLLQVQLLVAGGLKGEDVCVLAYYSKQVWRIRNFLRLKRLNTVSSLSSLC